MKDLALVVEINVKNVKMIIVALAQYQIKMKNAKNVKLDIIKLVIMIIDQIQKKLNVLKALRTAKHMNQ